MPEVSLEQIVRLAKQRGFVLPGSEIYGGLRNSWDYGPLGALLKDNIKRAWWQRFVRGRLDIEGLDAALIMNPKVWAAAGHVETFSDPMVECKNCHVRFRADQIETDKPCQNCGVSGQFTDPAEFNLMFKTFMGPTEDSSSLVYLRPETAQAMFVNFPSVVKTTRQRVPFGIAQIGKAFRNEITPGNFIFRTREFEQMEIEFFVPPETWEEHFETWRKEIQAWISFCGIKQEKVHELEVPAAEMAHYSQRTIDFEFDFPFGRDELYGLSYRTDYDLKRHQEHSGQDMSYTDPITNKKYLPHVIEPTFGVDRTLLAMLLSAWDEEEVNGEKRTVLHLPAALAPYQAAVLPLSKKKELEEVARPLGQELAQEMSVDYDVTQSIGRRYRRQDEIGTPYCVTVDFDTLKDNAVTIRDRDSMEQERVSLTEVKNVISKKLKT